MRLARPVIAAVLLGLLLATMLVLQGSMAGFSSLTGSIGNSATSAQMAPAGGLTVTRGCSGLSARWMTLQWTGSPSGPTTRYRIYRSVAGGAFASLTTVAHGANPHTHMDSGLSVGTGYSYYVVAEVGGTTWMSSASNTAGAATHGTLCTGA